MTGIDSGAATLCARSLELMASGTREDFERVYHPDAVNREAPVEPPPAREPGPAGIYATAEWLRGAFADLHFEIHETVEQGDLVVLHVTMSGHHTGEFINYQPGTIIVDTVMPATGKAFAITQTHWFRIRDGLIIEHWANRDDLAMARQAGWVPPSPTFLLRAALAKRRAQKHPS